jgi:hypothetical protein
LVTCLSVVFPCQRTKVGLPRGTPREREFLLVGGAVVLVGIAVPPCATPCGIDDHYSAAAGPPVGPGSLWGEGFPLTVNKERWYETRECVSVVDVGKFQGIGILS